MRRAERLFRLVHELRSRGISRAEDLATVFEVSVSTIYRDMAHLQASGLPIEGEAGVGYILRPGFDLPNLTFTYDQLDALAVGLAFVERTGDPALAQAAQEARAKLQAALPDPEERKLSDAPFFSLQPKPGPSSDAQIIRQAIRETRVLDLLYCNAAGEQTRRRMRPLVIWDLPNGWMCSGWCELRDDFRTFRNDRISDLYLTDQTFDNTGPQGLRAFLDYETCASH